MYIRNVFPCGKHVEPTIIHSHHEILRGTFPVWFPLIPHCHRLTLAPSVACCSYYDCRLLPKNKMLKQHKKPDGTHKSGGEWERIMNCVTRWKWEASYIFRTLGTWFPRTAHLFHLVDSRHSASALSLRISHSRKRFETKCLAVCNSCVTFDCSFT